MRARQARLIGVLLSAPFFIAGALAQTLFLGAGPALMLALIFGVFGVAFAAVVLVAATGSDRTAALLAMAAALVPATLALAASGGGSPVAALMAAFAFEAGWVWRSRRAVLVGLSASAVAIIAAAFVAPWVTAGSPVAVPSAWQWLVPILYAATVAVRSATLAEERRSRDAGVEASGLDRALDAVVIRMSPNGEVLDASAKALALFGLAPELIIGGGFFERIHVADRVGYLCALADLREGAAEHRKVEVRLRLPAGSADRRAGNFQAFSLEIGSGGGEEAVLVAVARPIGELAELRQAAVAARASLQALEVAKGRFLASVSHELRTPLNAIIGFADMLDQGLVGSFADQRQKEYVALIRDSGHHLLSVVNAILDVSKIEAGTYPIFAEPFRFADAVAMCHSMLSFQAGAKRIAFTTELGRDAGEINADRRAVQQMLINLAANAIKFTPEGGSVVIGARRIGSRLHFWVSDTGIGIGADDLARLGQPFMQVRNDYTRQHEGTGLGLSLVKGLVTLHDGTMTIDSAPDEGTTVTISLPIAGPAPRPGDRPSDAGAAELQLAKERNDGALRKTA